MSDKDLSKDEVESKILSVERDLKEFLEELPRYIETIEDVQALLALFKKSIELGNGAQDYGKGRSLTLKTELSIMMIKQHLKKIERARQECTSKANHVVVPSDSECNSIDGSSVSEGEDSEQGDGNIQVHRGIADMSKGSKQSKPTKPEASVTKKPIKTINDAKWLQRLEELCQYKEEHGHCNVPSDYDENPQLGVWVRTQRAHYGNKSPCMTKERIKLLRELGFTWVIRPPFTKGPQASWKERFEQLKQYKAQYGDCNVPRQYAENPQLGKWVDNQRTHYRLLMDGKKSIMSNARARSLRKEGFQWSLLPRRGPRKHP